MICSGSVFLPSIFIIVFIYLYFGCAGSSLPRGLFSRGEQGLLLLRSTGSRVLGLQ